MTATSGMLPGVAACFVFVLAFAVYAWTASPAMGWLDSPEFIAAATTLGVSHSPGHPTSAMVGAIAWLLPVGDLTTRVNLLSAVAQAGAAAALYGAAAVVIAAAAPSLDLRMRRLGAAGVALGFALCHAAWLQAVRAEVYALEILLVATALWLALRYLLADAQAHHRDRRMFYAAGLLAGLALATHHFITLTAMVPVALAALASLGGTPRRAQCMALTCALALLGLGAFAYLPVRASRHPMVNWGAPHTAERFYWTVSAKAFQKSMATPHVSSPGEDAAQIAVAAAQELPLPVAFLSLLGAYLGIRLRRLRPAAAALLGLLGLAMGGRIALGFDAEIPDDYGYILPGVAALWLLAAVGAASVCGAVAEARPRHGRTSGWALVLLFAGVAVLQPMRVGAVATARDGYASEILADAQLEALPPRALVLTAYFQTTFRLWAIRAVEAARPDVVFLDRSFLTYPGALEEARRAHPELEALLTAPLRAGAPTPVAELTKVAQVQPIAVELHLNLDAAADGYLVPAGAFARFASLPAASAEELRAAAEAEDDRWRRALAQALASQAAPLEDRSIRDALLWHDVMRAQLFCRQERLRAAQTALDHAWSLAPGDIALHELAKHCELSVP